MAPRALVKGKSSKPRSILDFAAHLQQTLAKDHGRLALDLADFNLYFEALPLPSNALSSQDRIELNREGVALWNCCSKLRRGCEITEDIKDLARARAFAYLLLQSAARIGRTHSADVLKVFKSSLKAAKECLATNLLGLALKILEFSATQHEALSKDDAFDAPIDVHDYSSASSEYLLLRLALAWKQEHEDIAELFYSRIKISDLTKNSDDLERFLDYLLEIGTEESEKKHFEVAIRWLKRAADMLEQSRVANPDADIGELELNVQHAYVRALLAVDEPEAGNEAHRILDLLRKSHGQKLAVILLQLEILSRDPSPNAEAFYSEIGAMSRSIHLLDSNVKLVMHYIHHLRGLNECLAWKALKQFIVQRLTSHDANGSTEGAVVTLIWMLTSPLDQSHKPIVEDVTSWLQDIYLTWNRCLTAEAVHGALVLLWKQVEATASAQDHALTIGWCQVSLHQIFERAGDQNIGRISRKIAMAHLSLGNPKAALEALSAMPSAAQDHRLSRFLSYSVAIRIGDEKRAQQLLSSLAALPDEGNRLLFACVSETMRYGSKRQGAILLQRILDKYNYDPPPEVDTCALLRCTTRLLLGVLEEESDTDEELLSRLCAIFKAASRYSGRCNRERSLGNYQCPFVECEWFSKIGYNIAVDHIKEWPSKYIIDVLQYTSEIQYPFHDAGMIDSFHKHKYLHGSSIVFIQAILYTSVARLVQPSWDIDDIPRTAYDARSRPDSADLRQILYQKVFEKCTEYAQISSQRMNPDIGPDCEDYSKPKQLVLLPLAFEAILHLGERESRIDELSLLQILEQARKTDAPPCTFALFADMILSSVMAGGSAPDTVSDQAGALRLSISTAVMLLRKIINAVRDFDEYDIAQASRWIRCVVQLVLEGSKSQRAAAAGFQDANFKLLDEITDQAIALATPAVPKDSIGYPADELEWLATILFNLAIDLHVAQQEQTARHWAGKALGVADVLANGAGAGAEDRRGGDGGLLARVLRERMGRLRWL